MWTPLVVTVPAGATVIPDVVAVILSEAKNRRCPWYLSVVMTNAVPGPNAARVRTTEAVREILRFAQNDSMGAPLPFAMALASRAGGHIGPPLQAFVTTFETESRAEVTC